MTETREPQTHSLTAHAVVGVGGPPAYLFPLPESQYWTGRPCPRGHVAPRSHRNHGCTQCAREDCRAYDARNRERHRARWRAWAERHPKDQRERVLRWRRANPFRAYVHRVNARAASRYGATDKLSADDVRQVFERDRRCLVCGSESSLTLDHIVPLSRGGRNVAGNVQLLCAGCNRRKCQRTIDYRGAAPALTA